MFSRKTSPEQPFGNYLLFDNTCTETPRMYSLSCEHIPQNPTALRKHKENPHYPPFAGGFSPR